MGTLVKNNGSLFPTFPSLFDDFLTRDLFDWGNKNYATSSTLPAVNVRETNDNFELEVAAPGLKKEDFNVELENHMLVISAETETVNESVNNNNQYARREFSYQSFKRSFALPEGMVDADHIEAHYEDGILQITVPKKEEAKMKPTKRIEIA